VDTYVLRQFPPGDDAVTYEVGVLPAWDRQAAAHATPAVEDWTRNYAGVGRPHLTGQLLRHRSEAWIDELLTNGG
jgi:hypothetical protein